MQLISKSRKGVREALAQEGWHFVLVTSSQELSEHATNCRTLNLPAGSESDNRVRSIREETLRQLPWEFRRNSLPRWLSYISKDARRRLQHYLPVTAEFCLTHGFIFLLADVWAERDRGRWRVHRPDGPAVLFQDQELYFWRGWRVSRRAVMNKPTAERILAEPNQTDREVMLQRIGVENFIQEAGLKHTDTFRDSTLLKVDTVEKTGGWQDGKWQEVPLSIAFLRVICPSTQKTYFLRVNPAVETAKVALESTLPGYTRDWTRDLVAET